MKQIAEFRRYADICRQLSLDMRNAVSKRQLMEMATVWTMLAIECEAGFLGADDGAAREQAAACSARP
jgi:hypothetical protein